MIRIAVSGAGGRMGRSVVVACHADPGVTVAAALEQVGAVGLGTDAGEVAGIGAIGVPICATLEPLAAPPDVLIDFSSAQGTLERVQQCSQAGLRMVIGTTGLDAAAQAEVRQAATRIAVVMAPNMSVGINLMFALTGQGARTLQQADVEILDTHHAAKRDAPSGTALELGRIVREERTAPADDVYGRRGGVREAGSIGYASLRAADVIGEHTVMFAWAGERLELIHRATDRMAFADGAVRAVHWVMQHDSGLYDMQDVLGLRSISNRA